MGGSKNGIGAEMAEPNAPKWKEALPEANCPPKDAAPVSKRVVLRLVPEDPAKPEHFLSHAGQNKSCPKRLDPCRWAACSVYAESVPQEVLEGLARLPTLGHMKFIAHVIVDENSGVICPHADKPEHLSFWMYENFEPHKAVVKLVALP